MCSSLVARMVGVVLALMSWPSILFASSIYLSSTPTAEAAPVTLLERGTCKGKCEQEVADRWGEACGALRDRLAKVGGEHPDHSVSAQNGLRHCEEGAEAHLEMCRQKCDRNKKEL
eukprot:TRINITY_DN58753_c0_g1_i1.p3 TRINITY_DN58753_c0_g1~~TRINITY_DN58753_c0_g1_i1.p3  ORF type:complete len:116 (-),score=34.29 TRINITY_DN58753_c0_g1_i1:112-459(-)